MMSEEAYARARKLGLKEYHGRMQRHQNPFLPVLEEIDERPLVTITFFKPDERKAGGSYSTVLGQLKKVDEFNQILVMEDDTVIPFNCIFDIQ